MEEKKLVEIRGEIIERSINIETLICALITQHYFNEINFNFFVEVLHDEYFNFILKINILSKILGPGVKTSIENLRSIGKIRNHFAHINLNINEIVIDPKKPGEAIDFEGMYKKFELLASDSEKFLAEKMREKGVVLEKHGS